MTSLKELVSGKVQFLRFRDGELWYRTQPGGFDFPVPIADTGTATFATEDRAILFMRWIRKHRELIESSKPNIYDVYMTDEKDLDRGSPLDLDAPDGADEYSR